MSAFLREFTKAIESIESIEIEVLALERELEGERARARKYAIWANVWRCACGAEFPAGSAYDGNGHSGISSNEPAGGCRQRCEPLK